jgi:hypothetical protein
MTFDNNVKCKAMVSRRQAADLLRRRRRRRRKRFFPKPGVEVESPFIVHTFSSVLDLWVHCTCLKS